MLDWLSDGQEDAGRTGGACIEPLTDCSWGSRLTVLNASQCNVPRTAFAASSDLGMAGKSGLGWP